MWFYFIKWVIATECIKEFVKKIFFSIFRDQPHPQHNYERMP